MNGGKKGLLVNSENLCSPKAKRTAIVRYLSHSGAVYSYKPTVANSCKRHKKRDRAHKRHSARSSSRASLMRLLRVDW
jgi:hypothetical protein